MAEEAWEGLSDVTYVPSSGLALKSACRGMGVFSEDVPSALLAQGVKISFRIQGAICFLLGFQEGKSWAVNK